MPFAGRAVYPSSDAYRLYCDVLLLLTALDGGEAILDRLTEAGVGTVPLVDRWAWRSRLHLPTDVWASIEEVLRWPEAPSTALTSMLDQRLERVAPLRLTWEDFAFERIDVQLDAVNDLDVARAVRLPDASEETLLGDLCITSAVQKDLCVRIGQVSAQPVWKNFVSTFPRIERDTTTWIMEQVASAFQTQTYDGEGRAPELVILPEVAVPSPEAVTVRNLVARTGIASLAGLSWQVLQPAYRGTPDTPPARRWFVNEAELVVPVESQGRGPRTIRWFRVRKPLPAHVEIGLARAVDPSNGLAILPGQRWYRFVHKSWGDFTVAICSDLLDPAPWRSLRGELLHLFMVGYNKDVDLYEALTWVRAYENYVNLVSVNHGSIGGSFLWTPRRSHGRELAKLRGGDLFVIADVKLPVRALLAYQQTGVQAAIASAPSEWKAEPVAQSEFRAPPPGFVRTAVIGDIPF